MPTPELAYDVARVYERMSEYDAAIEYYLRYKETAHLSAEEAEEIDRRVEQLRQLRRRLREQLFVAPPSREALAQEARAFFERGVALFQRGQLEPALEAFAAALQFAPLPEIHFNMAVVAERLGRRQDAIDHYREYLRLRPDAPDRGEVERRITRLRSARRVP